MSTSWSGQQLPGDGGWNQVEQRCSDLLYMADEMIWPWTGFPWRWVYTAYISLDRPRQFNNENELPHVLSFRPMCEDMTRLHFLPALAPGSGSPWTTWRAGLRSHDRYGSGAVWFTKGRQPASAANEIYLPWREAWSEQGESIITAWRSSIYPVERIITAHRYTLYHHLFGHYNGFILWPDRT